jgi:hypothetical protein
MVYSALVTVDPMSVIVPLTMTGTIRPFGGQRIMGLAFSVIVSVESSARFSRGVTPTTASRLARVTFPPGLRAVGRFVNRPHIFVSLGRIGSVAKAA